MRTPSRPVPEAIVRWTARARYLRWLDALAAWLALWAIVATGLGWVPADWAPADVQAVVALVLLGVLTALPPLRVAWRPVSAWVALGQSRRLAAGDRAWYVVPGEVRLVLVTARRGFRVTIATGASSPAEAISVRRTRVLLIPADPPASPAGG